MPTDPIPGTSTDLSNSQPNDGQVAYTPQQQAFETARAAYLHSLFDGSNYAVLAKKFSLPVWEVRMAVERHSAVAADLTTAGPADPHLAAAAPSTRPLHSPASHCGPAEAAPSPHRAGAPALPGSSAACLVLFGPRDWTGSVRFQPS